MILESLFNTCYDEYDTSIIISSSHEFKSENYLLKIKAPEYISNFFQEINGHEYDLYIKDITNWYSNLDEQTKINITSFNSSELIRLLCNEIILNKIAKTKSAPKDELKSKTKNIKTPNHDDTITQKILDQEQSESLPSLSKNMEFQNVVNNEESTKDTEIEEEQYINKNIIKEEDLLKSTKICSLKDDADTLIFNIESDKLGKYLNYFPKEDSIIKPIIPELIKNIWNIILPGWTNLLKTLSFCQIMACIFILLHFEYNYYHTHKTYEMPYFKELGKFSKKNELKINELLKNKVDVSHDIFKKYNSAIIARKCSHNYIKKNIPKDKKFSSGELYNFNINILKNIKNNFSEYNTDEEKLKILFRTISFYSLKDLIYSKHFVYLEIRNFLLNYNELAQDIDAIYKNIIYNNKILKPFRKKYLRKIDRLLRKILGRKIKIVKYGSFFTGLSTELSDMDILIYDVKIKDLKKFGEFLKNALKKEDLNIEAHLNNKNSIPVITISFDFPKEYLTGINFSQKYLDGIKDDLNKIKIDITFTNDIKRVKYTKEIVKIIIDSLNKYKQLRPVILYLKTFFRMQQMYSTYKGGINSLSLFCLARNILVTYEKNGFDVNLFPKDEILFYISEKFGNYKYQYGIDKDGNDYTLKGKEIVEKEEDLRFIIKSPVDNEKNIAEGSYKPNKIIETFYLLFQNIKKDIFLKN